MLLPITDDGDQRPRGLHTYAFIPCSFLTQFAVLQHAFDTAKAPVGQDHRHLVVALDERMEVLVMHIHHGPIAVDHLTVRVQQPTQLDARAPTSFIFTKKPYTDLVLLC